MYAPRIRNGEIRMMQFLDGEIRIILKDDVLVFLGGRKGILPLVGI